MHLPTGEHVVQIRIARPTDRFEDIVAFYGVGLGLTRLRLWYDGKDGDHQGYDGVVFGLPGYPCHLEVTHHRSGSPGPAPSNDNPLVLYMPNAADIQAARDRLERFGHQPVPSGNPWWDNDGFTYEDPDGWRIVLMTGAGLAT